MIKNYPTLKNLVSLFFLLFSFVFINAQTANQNFIDVTNDITSPVCAGSNITVNFTAKNGDKTYEYYNNSSVYNVYISVAGTNNLILLKTYSTSGISYCGTDNCITTLQTSITIPTDLSTGSYIIRIYSELPEMKWYGPSNSFTVNSLPLSPSGPISGSRCGTGTVSLSVTNPGAGFTVDWYAASTGGSALSSGSGTNSFSTPNISSTTTYYAETRNTSTGCVSATRTAVTATVKTIPTITSNTPNFRCGTGTVSLSATASAGTINWYAASTGGVSLGTGTSYTTQSISATTTYYVDATNNGCTTTARTAITATVNPFPLASGSITGSPTVCQGQNTVAYSVPAITNATSYTWAYSGTGATISGTANNITINFPSNATSGNLTVIGTNACGNGTVSANYAITVNPKSVGGAATATASPICSGGSTIITLTGYTGTIQWQTNASGSFTNIPSATSATYSTPVLTNTTSYRAIVTSGVCNTSTSSVAIVTVNPLPAVPTTTNAFICTGSSATLVASGAITGQTYNWYTAVSGGSSVNTTNSYNTPALTSTTDYWVAVVNSNGCESLRTKATAYVNVKNIWTGNAYDENWNTAGNWCLGVVPIESNPASLDVIIPKDVVITMPDGSTTPNYPIIAAEGTSGVVNNIEIQLGASVTIAGVIDISTGTGTGNVLTIIGDLILNGIIDLNGESQLIQVTDSGLSGSGSIEIDQQGTGDSFNYNYWSSPVNSNLAGTKYSIGEVLRDENGGSLTNKNISFGTSHTWADGAASVSPAFIKLSSYWMYKLENSKGYAAWARVGNTGEMSVGQGYTMKGSNTILAEQNYTFVGKPNNGTIELDVNKGNEYLVGNPYPSAIDADQFLIDNGPTGTNIIGDGSALHFWEHSGGGTHNLAGYQGGYATYNLSGGASAATGGQVAGVGTSVNAKKIPRRYIPIGQAFFVVGDFAGKINFNNGQRIFVKESQVYKDKDNKDVPYSVFMKTNNTKSRTDNTNLSDLRPKFRIGYDAPKISHRELLLTVDERATKEVDWGFDAEIFEIFVDDFYWMLDGKKYIIQGTNAVGLNSEVPLGIQLSKTGMITVKIDALENVDDDTTIYLKDKLTGESFNMRDKPVQLNLTAGKYADRFVLVFKTQKLMAEDVVAEVLIPAAAQSIIEGIHVFMNNAIGELQIKNNSVEEILSVALINSLGQTVKTWNSNFNIRTISLPVSTATGVYLVQITTKNGATNKKIIVD